LDGPLVKTVLDAVADEAGDVAVFHAHRNTDDDGPLGQPQPFHYTGIDVNVLGNDLQLPAGHAKGRRAFVNGQERLGSYGILWALPSRPMGTRAISFLDDGTILRTCAAGSAPSPFVLFLHYMPHRQ